MGPEHGDVFLGLDIGGTKVSAGLVHFLSGEMIIRHVQPTNAGRRREAILADLVALCHRLEADAGARGLHIAGIGAGIAELVDTRGCITSTQTFGWSGRELENGLSAIAPAVIESDVRCAALAEALFGAGRGYELFVYVTVGSGISSCLVQDGEPFRGARGNALVLSTGPSTTWCTECGAKTTRVLEDFSSGLALSRRYREASGKTISGSAVAQRAVAGDACAVEILRSAGEALGSAIGQLANVLDPEAVVIGGGLGTSGGIYWDAVVASTRAHIWAEATRALPIEKAGLGADSGVIGAAAASWRAHGRRTGNDI